MTQAERKRRAKSLEGFLGELVSIQLKNLNTIEGDSIDTLCINNAVLGYCIDIDEFYIYLGESPEGYDTAVELDEVGLVKILENVPEELVTFVPEDENVH